MSTEFSCLLEARDDAVLQQLVGRGAQSREPRLSAVNPRWIEGAESGRESPGAQRRPGWQVSHRLGAKAKWRRQAQVALKVS